MELFPAVVIGGPPDSGKSVLTAHLTQALRERGVQHYVLRACPDGEGDWTYLADQVLVRTILVPRKWTPAFVDHICRDLEQRHLPLIVDTGGRPQPWQEAIFDHCTHAILLTLDDASRAEWLDRVARHGLLLLADLHSELKGECQLVKEHPVLRGTLAGLVWPQVLVRGSQILARGPQVPVRGPQVLVSESKTSPKAEPRLQNPLFDALVDRLAQLFAYDPQALRKAHYDSAPVETVVDLDRLARALDVSHRGEQPDWEPHHLPAVLDYLPEGVPLGLYGRGPNWLYAALALLAHPAKCCLFDVRLGWVFPAPVGSREPHVDGPLQVTACSKTDHTRLEFSLPRGYIDYLEAEGLRVPCVPTNQGVILSGKLPFWLWTGLVLAYRQAAWLAVYQPQVGGAVVVRSQTGIPPLGSVLP